MIETTYVVTKPDPVEQRVQCTIDMVMRDLWQIPHERYMFRIGRLLVRDVRGMYAGLPRPIMDATIAHMTAEPVMVIRVIGENAIANVLRRRGVVPNPFKCERGTWRREVADLLKAHCVSISEAGKYWFNFVHTPRNVEEATECEYLFQRFFV